jgi:hypothetical protein
MTGDDHLISKLEAGFKKRKEEKRLQSFPYNLQPSMKLYVPQNINHTGCLTQVHSPMLVSGWISPEEDM